MTKSDISEGAQIYFFIYLWRGSRAGDPGLKKLLFERIRSLLELLSRF